MKTIGTAPTRQTRPAVARHVEPLPLVGRGGDATPPPPKIPVDLGGQHPSQTLGAFLATVGQLTTAEREAIIDQALVMIENVYVHLPLKRAMHAVNPGQQLRLLRQRHTALSERAFHDAMISIYTHLRDLHTNYVLPDPYNACVAFVPFRMEHCDENGTRQYIVTQVGQGVADPSFKPGVTVTHWNNVPIGRAVELNAEREAGGNPDARHSRGLESMTSRWMGMSLPPDEDRVTLRYRYDAIERTIEFPWQVLMPDDASTGVDLLADTGPQGRMLGVDVKGERQRRVLKLLFSPESVALERRVAKMVSGTSSRATRADVDLATTSKMPDVFSSFRMVQSAHGDFAYIRLRTFNVNNDEAFLREFIRIIGLLPQTGLILDVRGNGGGLIPAGERLLQLLTPRAIAPARFHFINTPATRRLCELNGFIATWTDSIAQAVQTGASLSQGFALMPDERYNDIGQQYQGPVVLVIDALCYSTTDIFAAGFRDHQIGQILGTSSNTGAGGANVWSHDLLRQLWPDADSPFKAVARNVSFRVAVRQTTRVGAHSGVPIEDLGVEPDAIHSMTRNDVLCGNVDLIEHAASLLAQMPGSSLVATIKRRSEARFRVAVTTRNLARVDAFLDGRPILTFDVNDGARILQVPRSSATAAVLELRGYQDGRLVAATRVPVSPRSAIR